MPQPQHTPDATAPRHHPSSTKGLDAGRRTFLGLGGAITLALATAGSAAASTSPAARPVPVRGRRAIAGCPSGLDPAERSGSRASLLRASRAVETHSTVDAAAAPAVDGAASRFAQCAFVSRAGWGADESFRFTAAGQEVWVPTYWPVQTFTVHHTADGNSDPDPAARIRAIYHNQAVNLGYGDIGYQFLIDDAGRVYEGRWSGDDGLPGFNAEGLMVNGAHVAGYNAGNVGIALLGDFTSALPSDAAYHSLVSLLAVLTRWQGVDPLARVHYVNPISGAQADEPAIAGHRNWAATLCPGDAFAPMLGQLRQDVADR
jgi:hypothetical protein